MKLLAKIKLNGEKNANHLIRSFFDEFNPESSILIKGKDAELEVVFEEPPLKTIDAIVHCDIIEFSYEKTTDECEKAKVSELYDQNEEKVEAETSVDHSEEVAEVFDISDQNDEEAEGEDSSAQNAKMEVTTKSNAEKSKLLEISELSEIAKKSSSYEDFVKAVLEWLDFGQKKELFAEIIKASEEIETISWKNIKNKLSSKGIAYAKNEDICIASKFKRRFKESITPIPFLKSVVEYKTFDFVSEEPKEDGVKICSISEFSCLNEIFANVDKSKPVDIRVTYILDSMGIKKLTLDEQALIFKIARTAVMSEKYELLNEEFIMKKAIIYADKMIYARILFSKFVNGFLKEHNCDEKIKFINFLEQLWKAVRTEKE